MTLFKKKKQKIKFKDRPFIKYVKEHAPELLGNSLDFVGEITGITLVEKLGERIAGREGSEHFSADGQAHALELFRAELDHHAKIQGEVTKRWLADMKSTDKLSKLARPIVLLYSWVLITIIIILSFCGLTLPDAIIYMVDTMCGAVTLGYFGLRTVDKRNEKKYFYEKKQI